MRKLVSLGLLALIFSIFSSQVSASNAGVCDDLKGSAKGLHGLCVAWHNADEKNKDKIAAKFDARSDVPLEEIINRQGNPESNPDFVCPCFTDISFNDICLLGSPTMSFIYGFINVVEWQDADLGLDEFFSADSRGCGYEGSLASYASLLAPYDFSDPEFEVPQCIAEVEMIAAMFNGGSCD